ncbi:MAG: hypothetical protein H0W62_01420 [Chitinophagales bacterium]|nr:hypothetical protein [Chitinophagales bacterium]
MRTNFLTLNCILILALSIFFLHLGVFNQFANAQTTTIYPSATFQIPKADINDVRNRIANHPTKQNKGFETLNERRTNHIQRNSAAINSDACYNEDDNPDERLMNQPPRPVLGTNFDANKQFPFFRTAEGNIATSNGGKIVAISNSWIYYFDETGALIFMTHYTISV